MLVALLLLVGGLQVASVLLTWKLARNLEAHATAAAERHREVVDRLVRIERLDRRVSRQFPAVKPAD